MANPRGKDSHRSLTYSGGATERKYFFFPLPRYAFLSPPPGLTFRVPHREVSQNPGKQQKTHQKTPQTKNKKKKNFLDGISAGGVPSQVLTPGVRLFTPPSAPDSMFRRWAGSPFWVSHRLFFFPVFPSPVYPEKAFHPQLLAFFLNPPPLTGRKFSMVAERNPKIPHFSLCPLEKKKGQSCKGPQKTGG